MQGIHIIKQCPVYRSARVMQTEGLFDVEAKSKDVREWDVHLPIHEKEWKIGLIVGPSGCGKTVLITEMFPDNIVSGLSWPEEKSILDAFPNGMGIKEITSLLSSVGFSSPPSWLKPYHVLSNGEKFRVQMARVLAEKRDLAVVDEYTSVVDRTVAQIGSVAVSKTIRKGKGQFIAVTCHYDVIDWLQPDWVYCPIENRFEWRFLQPRPAIPIDIIRVHHSAWEYFKAHHYLTKSIHKGARCFVGVYNGRPAAFAAVM
jgi:ABC-type lipoprotein export system ATPase subunit